MDSCILGTKSAETLSSNTVYVNITLTNFEHICSNTYGATDNLPMVLVRCGTVWVSGGIGRLHIFSAYLSPNKILHDLISFLADLQVAVEDLEESRVVPSDFNAQLNGEPFRPQFSDLDYADVDYKSYGPINYKAASIAAIDAKKFNTGRQEKEESPLL